VAGRYPSDDVRVKAYVGAPPSEGTPPPGSTDTLSPLTTGSTLRAPDAVGVTVIPAVGAPPVTVNV